METKHAEGDQGAKLVETLTKLRCEVKVASHGGHTDVNYRCPRWQQLALKSLKEAHLWESWLKKYGFETKHAHGGNLWSAIEDCKLQSLIVFNNHQSPILNWQSKMKSFLIVAFACFALSGCSKNDTQIDEAPPESSEPIVMNEMPPLLDMGGHPEHGPHGGELVELGKEAFHIEMLHGSGAVAMYVLDGSATQPVAIEADKLTVSLKHDGEVKSFELLADPQAEDQSGMSSRFTSTQAEMDQWMESGAEGVVILQIEGKSFTGKISHDHDHDHEGHSH